MIPGRPNSSQGAMEGGRTSIDRLPPTKIAVKMATPPISEKIDTQQMRIVLLVIDCSGDDETIPQPGSR